MKKTLLLLLLTFYSFSQEGKKNHLIQSQIVNQDTFTFPIYKHIIIQKQKSILICIHDTPSGTSSMFRTSIVVFHLVCIYYKYHNYLNVVNVCLNAM
jgi:hypothetical protein